MTDAKTHTMRIPPDALKRHIAILGMNGSGKTSVAKAEIIEPALQASQRVCNIDPTGVGWGLRLSRTGKSPGFKIYIVGGERQDFALEPRSGETWAEIVGTSSDSFIFDTSQMTVGKRSEWFKDFAESLIVANKGPLHFVLDEAHLFAPQSGATGGGIAPQMLHATNNLLSLGRSKGLRITMLSQRPAKLHKDSLTQAHTMIAMMMVGPQDRAAVKDWIADQADAEKGKEIIASLPSLMPGEGWIWAPREKVLERVRFARPTTFDSSSAPDTEEGAAVKLVPIDPEAIVGRLAQVAQDKKANDPAVLRAEVARLTRELAAKPRPTTAVEDIDAAAGAYTSGHRDGYSSGYDKGAADQRESDDVVLKAYVAALKDVRELAAANSASLPRMLPIVKGGVAPDTPPPRAKSPTLPARLFAQRQPRPEPSLAPDSASRTSWTADGTPLTGPQRELLTALKWWVAMGHQNVTRAQLAGKAKWKVKGSHLRNRLSEMKSAGLIEYPRDGIITLTVDGDRAAPSPNTNETLLDSLRAMMTGPQREVFEGALVAGREVTRMDLAASIAWEPNGSHLRNRLSELAAMEIIEYPNKGTVRLQEWVL